MSADPRETIREALSGVLDPDQVKVLVDKVLAMEKRTQGDFTCKKCGQRQRHIVLIPDSVAVVKALTDLLNQGYGRPQEAAAPDTEQIVFKRIVKLVEPDEDAA